MHDERHSGVATRNLLFVFVIVFYGNSFLWLGLVSVAQQFLHSQFPALHSSILILPFVHDFGQNRHSHLHLILS